MTLHFAPERCLSDALRPLLAKRYVTTDLERPDVDIRADITAPPFEDLRFGLILCNHVLEHVVDEAAALTELGRVLAADGHAVITVPQEKWRQVTYEKPAVTEPVERERHFGQHDHVRAYGDDFAQRLTSAGFEVEVVAVEQLADADGVRRFGLQPGERIYICTR